MVNQTGLRWIVLFIGLASGTGCGMLREIWGEPGPVAKVATVESGSGCKGLDVVLTGSSQESLETINCFESQLESSWKQIKLQNPDRITAADLDRLVSYRLLRFSTSTQDDLRRAKATLKLLSPKGELTRAEIKSWFEFVRVERDALRDAYTLVQFQRQNLIQEGALRTTFEDFEFISRLAGRVLNRLEFEGTTSDWVGVIYSILGKPEPEQSAMNVASLNLLREVAGSICPSIGPQNGYAAPRVALCFERLPFALHRGATWINYFLDPGISASLPLKQILNSGDQLLEDLGPWLNQEGLSSLKISTWKKFAEALNVPLPEDIDRSLKWIPRLGGQSTSTQIHPTAYLFLLKVARTAHTTFLAEVDKFHREVERGRCANWRTCVLPDSMIPLMSKLRNPSYAPLNIPLNGSMWEKVSYFEAISKLIVRTFDDDHNGIITADLQNEDQPDEVLQVVQFASTFARNVAEVFGNILRSTRGEPIVPGGMGLSFNDMNGPALSKLIAVGAELFMNRPKEDARFFFGLIQNITNVSPETTVFLDQDALAATLVVLDQLSDYRKQTLTRVRPNPLGRLRRAEVLVGLRSDLKKSFPRFAKSCEDFGWDESCGRTFNQILPKGESDWIKPGDLDGVTLIAMSMEGILNSCDANQDGKLEWELLNGDDELDCTFVRIKDVVTRLMEADIIRGSPSNKAKIRAGLEILNSFFLTRVVGKVGLIRGTRDWGVVHVPLFFLHNGATMGSMMSLMGEIAEEGNKN